MASADSRKYVIAPTGWSMPAHQCAYASRRHCSRSAGLPLVGMKMRNNP